MSKKKFKSKVKGIFPNNLFELKFAGTLEGEDYGSLSFLAHQYSISSDKIDVVFLLNSSETMRKIKSVNAISLIHYDKSGEEQIVVLSDEKVSINKVFMSGNWAGTEVLECYIEFEMLGKNWRKK